MEQNLESRGRPLKESQPKADTRRQEEKGDDEASEGAEKHCGSAQHSADIKRLGLMYPDKTGFKF